MTNMVYTILNLAINSTKNLEYVQLLLAQIQWKQSEKILGN